MKTKSIYYILLMSVFGLMILGALTQYIQYDGDKQLMQDHSINGDVGLIILQCALVLMGVLLGFIIFTPRGKKEFTKYDFIKPKGEITK